MLCRVLCWLPRCSVCWGRTCQGTCLTSNGEGGDGLRLCQPDLPHLGAADSTAEYRAAGYGSVCRSEIAAPNLSEGV